ncbi:MAG: hypothetical protein P5680_11820, partial [Limnospira sp. PMC 737.11]|uniref:hypothetical protein n=1 Tax=Limnospira sp. PMC 737.11 TaxID=2981095 RepID=UPI0028E119F7
IWHGLGFDRILIIELRIFGVIVPYCPKMSSKSWIKFWLRLLLEVGTIELVGRTSTLKRRSHQTPV